MVLTIYEEIELMQSNLLTNLPLSLTRMRDSGKRSRDSGKRSRDSGKRSHDSGKHPRFGNKCWYEFFGSLYFKSRKDTDSRKF